MSLLRAAVRPLSATKAACSRGEASAQTPGLHALQPHVEPSSARPPLRGSRVRVSLLTGLPYMWARGLPSTQMRPDLSTHVRGSFTVAHQNPGAETQTPPAHQYANTRQHTGTTPPAGKARTRKHVHSLRRRPCLRSLGEAVWGFHETH